MEDGPSLREALSPVLRALALTALVVGTLALFVRPPSFTGAGTLAMILLGGLALVLVTAWGTVRLTGRGTMSEPEFERLVRRSEALARLPADDREAGGFEALVAEAIDELPREFRDVLEDIPVVVSRGGRAVGAYGHYFGDTVAHEHHEDRIVLYQDTLERDFGHDPELLRGQVERTLRHELAHHLGWDERGVGGLGL
jgi:predicted Zn-dependent protease with MMP-like domain